MSNSTLSNKLIYDLILKEYNIKANSIELVKAKATAKDRMVYKIDTISKSYCLKKVYYDEETLLFIYSSIIWLNLHNISCPILIPTTNNGRYFKYNNMLFILTPWIEGIRCNYDILTHLEISLKNLANMHIAGKNFSPIKGSKVLTGSDSSSFSYSKHFGDLKKYIDICSNQKDIFSKKIFDYKDYILTTAYISVLYSKLIDTNALPKTLCHKDYVNKNIIIDTNMNPWIIDFDKCRIDYRISDLCYFFRRFLRRENTKWNFFLFSYLLNIYEKISPLNFNEHIYLFSYLSFPQKHWRLCKDFLNRPTLTYEEYNNLLNKYNNQSENHIKFIFSYKFYIYNRFKNERN